MVTVLRRREQGAEEEHEAVRVLVRGQHLLDDVGRSRLMRLIRLWPTITKPSSPDAQFDLGAAHIVEAEAGIKEDG